ncbi:unnamed protein product, partial [Fusarium langsethiae]
QEKALEKSAGTAKRTATNTTRITSRITNDGLQEGKNDTDPGAAMLQKVFGVLRILRDEFSKQQEATRSMIGDQQKTIRELEQKLDEYKQEIQETKAQMAEELRQVRGQLDSILKCAAMTTSTQTSPQTSYAEIARTPPTSQPSNVHSLSPTNSTPSVYSDTLFCTIDISRVSKEEAEKITACTVRSAVEKAKLAAGVDTTSTC